NLAGFERARRLEWNGFSVSVHVVAGNCDRRRSDRERTLWLHRRMRNAADMPDLIEEKAAFCVNGVGREAPAGNLFVRINTRHPEISMCLGRDVGRFADLEPAFARALTVILGVEFIRNVAWLLGAHTGEWSHNDTVLEGKRTE